MCKNTHQTEWKSLFSIRTGLRSGNTQGWMSTKMQTMLKNKWLLKWMFQSGFEDVDLLFFLKLVLIIKHYISNRNDVHKGTSFLPWCFKRSWGMQDKGLYVGKKPQGLPSVSLQGYWRTSGWGLLSQKLTNCGYSSSRLHASLVSSSPTMPRTVLAQQASEHSY